MSMMRQTRACHICDEPEAKTADVKTADIAESKVIAAAVAKAVAETKARVEADAQLLQEQLAATVTKSLRYDMSYMADAEALIKRAETAVNRSRLWGLGFACLTAIVVAMTGVCVLGYMENMGLYREKADLTAKMASLDQLLVAYEAGTQSLLKVTDEVVANTTRGLSAVRTLFNNHTDLDAAGALLFRLQNLSMPVLQARGARDLLALMDSDEARLRFVNATLHSMNDALSCETLNVFYRSTRFLTLNDDQKRVICSMKVECAYVHNYLVNPRALLLPNRTDELMAVLDSSLAFLLQHSVPDVTDRVLEQVRDTTQQHRSLPIVVVLQQLLQPLNARVSDMSHRVMDGAARFRDQVTTPVQRGVELALQGAMRLSEAATNTSKVTSRAVIDAMSITGHKVESGLIRITDLVNHVFTMSAVIAGCGAVWMCVYAMAKK